MTQFSDLTDQLNALYSAEGKAVDDAVAAQVKAAMDLSAAQAAAAASAATAAQQIAALSWQLANVPPAATHTRFGVDGEPLDVASFPRAAYCREYSQPGRGLKPIGSPASVALPHISFHDTPTTTLLDPWLDRVNRPIVLEHGHEPEGDTTTATYQGNVQALLNIVAAHPNGHYVTVAQTFTRYAQVHGKLMTDRLPATWQNLWVKGSGFIGFDCEVDTSIKGYPDPATFFAPAVAASKALGVPFLIPELGWPQQATDTDGSGLAAWYVACAAYLRTQNCAGVAAFNVKGTTGDYRLTGPARAAWQTVVASQ